LDIPYEEELKLKEAELNALLSPLDIKLDALIPSPKPSAYRNKMELAFGDVDRDGALALGMRIKRSFYEVATPLDCVLIGDDFKKIIAFTLEFFRASGEEKYHRKRHTGALRHLLLRRGESTGEILVLLSASSALKTDLSPWVEGLNALSLDGLIVGIMHAVNDGVADAVKNEQVTILYGRDYYFDLLAVNENEAVVTDHAEPLKFKIHAFAFFQTNTKAAEVLYHEVQTFAKLASGHQCAYDLYCGTGTIAQIIAPLFKTVKGIELSMEAINTAQENAERNKITNCDFIAGDVLHELDQLMHVDDTADALASDCILDTPKSRQQASEQASLPDLIIVDPPRDGLHPKALQKIAALTPPLMIYVACKPKSFVRDMLLLKEHGYAVDQIKAVDMFPRTPHVETVALLTRCETL